MSLSSPTDRFRAATQRALGNCGLARSNPKDGGKGKNDGGKDGKKGKSGSGGKGKTLEETMSSAEQQAQGYSSYPSSGSYDSGVSAAGYAAEPADESSSTQTYLLVGAGALVLLGAGWFFTRRKA